MYYILNKKYALRSFKLIPYALLKKHDTFIKIIDKQTFQTLLFCNGKTNLEENTIINDLLDKGIIKESDGSEALTNWQKNIIYDNRYMATICLQLTGRCNYNCLHCFNAKDNERLQSELSYKRVIQILDEAKDCGIAAFTITGGEPMLHPQFKEIIKAIYDRDMFVYEINTNGYFINQEILDFFKQLSCNPLIKISFDGIGHHDWLRNHKGAQEDALRAIKLCINNGFSVMAQMQMNKVNLNSILESIEYLDSIGIHSIRILRTTESPRWQENAKDNSLSIEEYYEESLKILKAYASKPHHAKIIFWQVIRYDPESIEMDFDAVACDEKHYRDSLPLCTKTRGELCIAANGNIYPCLQGSGLLDTYDMNIGNIFKDSLHDLLQSNSNYFKLIDIRIKERLKHNQECRTCEYWVNCIGGCPLLAFYETNGDVLGKDKWRCIFFKQGYYQRYKQEFNNFLKKPS